MRKRRAIFFLNTRDNFFCFRLKKKEQNTHVVRYIMSIYTHTTHIRIGMYSYLYTFY